ncbi:hypothetical protein CCOS865_02360 [Pseudomonas reidholzensis]|uniref:Lipoprotein n=1 Tax=Pseudomonas reidholzensis TaxID=1785162 RepID=A0A383RTU9_9PSED|nr:hypothetical protein [Pseudomonas reidholzensis]SYX90094.1 hypothetical protein CCOS865_02360 [Pseudomonas reidholzensis]
MTKLCSSNPLQRTALAVALTLGVLSVSGCGDDKQAPAVDTRTAAQKKADEVYNPTPEQKAQQAAERQARIDADKPHKVEFTDPGMGSDADYTDIGQTMVAFKIYNARRDWQESADDVADSSAVILNYKGVDPRLLDLEKKRKGTADGFEKADIAKEITGIVSEISEPFKNTQWVKVTLASDFIGLKSYDFTLKGFKVGEEFFTDKVGLTDLDKSNMAYGNQSKIAPPKATISNLPLHYNFGFVNATDDTLIKVEDEQLARKIEAARPTAKIEIYGFVQSVQRTRINGADQKDRYVYIQPQRIDIQDGQTGEVLLSHTL